MRQLLSLCLAAAIVARPGNSQITVVFRSQMKLECDAVLPRSVEPHEPSLPPKSGNTISCFL